jgi:hypothetical protein
LESALLAEKVRHGNNPVLTMCAANAVVTTDPAGGRKLNKAKAAGRIDGMVALTMAFGIAPLDDPEPSVDDWLSEPRRVKWWKGIAWSSRTGSGLGVRELACRHDRVPSADGLPDAERTA